MVLPTHPFQATADNVVCMPGTVKLSGEDQIISATSVHKSALHAATALAVVAAATIVLSALRQLGHSATRKRRERSSFLRALNSRVSAFVLLALLLAIVGLAVYLRSSALNNGTPVREFVGCARVVHAGTGKFAGTLKN
jgi:NADH:ubiquinone oxidoreductase subunit 4 (subunit M)